MVFLNKKDANMTSPFDILFKPIQIGPVTAPNRFYQVPHCNGFGYRMPQGMAAMRAMKAEGGWGVICTEETEIHHSSDLSPFFEGRIWDDADIPVWQLMTEAVHKHRRPELRVRRQHARPSRHSRGVRPDHRQARRRRPAGAAGRGGARRAGGAVLRLDGEAGRQRIARQRPEALTPLLTPEEAEAHKVFVATFKSTAIWTRYQP